MSLIVDFYRGTGTDSQGRRLRDILAWDDTKLEDVHDFIQWLFPLPEPSGFNRQAPQLTDDDRRAFAEEAALREALRSSFDRFCRFLGLESKGGRLVEAANFDERATEVWRSANHNWLRITRALRSLSLLGLSDEAGLLFAWIQASRTRFAFPNDTFHYWSNATKVEPVRNST